jgi:cytochrome P450 family 135
MLPPGPASPRAVQTLAWITRPGPWLLRLRARYGDAIHVRIANEGSWILLSDPDAIKQVFTGDPSALHAGEANVVLRPLLGPRSVLLLDEAPHMAQRKLLLPAFHGERLQAYGELIADIAEREIAGWPAGAPLAMRPRMQALTLEVIMRAVFGSRDERLRAALSAMLDWTTDARRLALVATLGPGRVERLGLFRRVLDPVDELLAGEIAARRARPGEDMLSLLAASGMGDAELRDELLTLLVAGHETTATALAWALERLARHPGAWARMGDETYRDAVIKETLRLRPVLPIVLRRLTRPLEIGGWALPAGVSVAPCIYLVHRRGDLYPDPQAFRPERFLERPPGTYTWIPFGGGVRRCLGASFAQFEMATVLRVIAERVERLEPAEPAGEPVARRAITLVPRRGALVSVARRHTAAHAVAAKP